MMNYSEVGQVEIFDYKQCQRKDGTRYGIPNTSDCGSGRKEVGSRGGDPQIDAKGSFKHRKDSKQNVSGKDVVVTPDRAGGFTVAWDDGYADKLSPTNKPGEFKSSKTTWKASQNGDSITLTGIAGEGKGNSMTVKSKGRGAFRLLGDITQTSAGGGGPAPKPKAKPAPEKNPYGLKKVTKKPVPSVPGPGKATNATGKQVDRILESGRITRDSIRKAEKALTDKGASPEYAQKYVKRKMLSLVTTQSLHSSGMSGAVDGIKSYGTEPDSKPLRDQKSLQKSLDDEIKRRKSHKDDPIRSLNEGNVYDKLVNKIDIPKARRDGAERMKDPAYRAKVYKALGIEAPAPRRSTPSRRRLTTSQIRDLNRETRANNQEAIRMMKASGMYDNQALDNINRYDAQAHRNAAKAFGYSEADDDFIFAETKKDMPCNKPKRSSSGNSSHVVKACGKGLPEEGKLIRFGQKGVTTAGAPKKGESDKQKARRKSFKARHAKNIAKGPSSAAYWADKVKWCEAFDEATFAEMYDFKTCARKDGSTYGIPSGSDCGSGRREVTAAQDKFVKKSGKEVGKVAGPAMRQRMSPQQMAQARTMIVDNLAEVGHQPGTRDYVYYTADLTTALQKQGMHTDDVRELMSSAEAEYAYKVALANSRSYAEAPEMDEGPTQEDLEAKFKDLLRLQNRIVGLKAELAGHTNMAERRRVAKKLCRNIGRMEKLL